MAAYLDVVLRGLLLALTAVAAGGVAWVAAVLRPEAGAKPDEAARSALRLVAAAAAGAALTQAAVGGIVLRELLLAGGAPVLGPFLDTTFARVCLARVVGALALAVTARRLARAAAPRAAWASLAGLALALAASSAVLGHAAARPEGRLVLGALDAVHQAAVAVWVGGLAHLLRHAAGPPAANELRERAIARRFSSLALLAVAVLAATGLALTVGYVGEPAALVGTGYGVMILTKVTLLAPVLGLAWMNRRLVHRASATLAAPRLRRLAEVELGLALTIVFVAASLTTLPPAADVTADRATLAEVAARFQPAAPRLSSPSIGELLSASAPLLALAGGRAEVERAWSEYNHHWAGLFVLLMGGLAVAERLGLRQGRHWPLVLLGLAAFVAVRGDPRAWPLGPAGFWESMALPDVLQHRLFVVLIVGFAVFEWAVRTGRLAPRPWAWAFPLLCAGAAGLLLTHSHGLDDLKEEFLTEVTHAPLGVLGAFAGWARWLEVRLPEAGGAPGWIWRACMLAVGVLLLTYREG